MVNPYLTTPLKTPLCFLIVFYLISCSSPDEPSPGPISQTANTNVNTNTNTTSQVIVDPLDGTEKCRIVHEETSAHAVDYFYDENRNYTNNWTWKESNGGTWEKFEIRRINDDQIDILKSNPSNTKDDFAEMLLYIKIYFQSKRIKRIENSAGVTVYRFEYTDAGRLKYFLRKLQTSTDSIVVTWNSDNNISNLKTFFNSSGSGGSGFDYEYDDKENVLKDFLYLPFNPNPFFPQDYLSPLFYFNQNNLMKTTVADYQRTYNKRDLTETLTSSFTGVVTKFEYDCR